MSPLPFYALEDCSNRHEIHLTHATTKPFQVNCLELLSNKTMSQSLLLKILGLKYWPTMVWRLVPYKRLDQEQNNHNCTKCGSSVHFNTFSIYVEMKSWGFSWWFLMSYEANKECHWANVKLTLSMLQGTRDWKCKGRATGKLFLLIGILLSFSFLHFYPTKPSFITYFS